MIQKLAKLGKYIPEDMFPYNPLGLSLDYEVEDIVFIHFSHTDEAWRYSGISVEKYSKAYAHKYLMKTAKGMATSNFPTLDIFSIDGLKKNGAIDLKESKYGKKLTYILEKHRPLFDGMINELEQNAEIASEIENRLKDFNRFALSIKINGNYIGEAPEFQETLEQFKAQIGNPDYYTYGKKIYEEHNKLCSVTNKIEPKIWGYVSPYKFYAVKTEYGAVPGGFDARTAWKNFPVSPTGAAYLERAQKFIEQYLSFRFCGYNYFLVPEKVLPLGDEEDFIDYIQDFNRFCLTKEGAANNQLEEDLIDLLKEKSNSASYTLFFYEKNNSEFKILASIEDIFPSYAKQIHDAKQIAEEHSIFKGLAKKKELYDLKFAFAHIKEFVPEQASFLEIVRSIFMQKTIDYSYLLGRIVTKFRTDFANNELYTVTVLKAFLLLKLLKKLNLFQQIKATNEVIMDNKYEHFFEEHKEFFNSGDAATKKAVFLEGVLVQNLLNIQYQERNATPFRSRLNSLKLNEKIVKRLLPEAIEKLEQYGKNYYKELEATISQYLLKANFALSDNELSFYFTMGMNLAKEFKPEKEHTNGE